MANVSDNLIMDKVEKNLARGKRLKLFKENESPDIESLLDVDIIWNILNISHKIESADSSEESTHKMMLQYANLNKVRAINRQTRAKANDAKVSESQFDKIVKKMIEKEKGPAEEIAKKKVEIVKKVVTNQELSEDEQIILDAAVESSC